MIGVGGGATGGSHGRRFLLLPLLKKLWASGTLVSLYVALYRGLTLQNHQHYHVSLSSDHPPSSEQQSTRPFSPVPRLHHPNQKATTTRHHRESQNDRNDEDDTHCLFPNSSIYRKVFVYPSWGNVSDGWFGSILSQHAQQNQVPKWPWLDHHHYSRLHNTSHYDLDGQHVQYATELLVHELLTNPHSCLRTYDPEQASLFYVPYLSSVDFHKGQKPSEEQLDYNVSPYGQAILDILTKSNYTNWEQWFGFTSKYWQRHNGSDHILVFSEPMHGLYHPRYKRGSYHYIHTQQQLSPPIILSVELSTSFVQQHPKCAAKNILLPYPNIDGRYFNGVFQQEATQLARSAAPDAASHHSLTAVEEIDGSSLVVSSSAALPVEQEAARNGDELARPATLFYDAGIHGRCKKVRRALQHEYRMCSLSYHNFHKNHTRLYRHGMHISTFCLSPGGDSPSSKRMFDCLHAGSIPIVLSHDFVWPFTTEFDPKFQLEPSTFALRYSANEYTATSVVNSSSCSSYLSYHQDRDNQSTSSTITTATSPKSSLEARLRHTITLEDIVRLRQQVRHVSENYYGWYKRRPDLVTKPLQQGIMPDGGAAIQLVKALEARVGGAKWAECQDELQQQQHKPPKDPNTFKC